MIDDADKLKCAKRELKTRQRVYPKWVAAGRMDQDKADHEIKVMEAIVADYRWLVNKERPI